ncbi:MAG: biopolymer transporter ExbD [Candidatus Krumholzibacteriia bacterium]
MADVVAAESEKPKLPPKGVLARGKRKRPGVHIDMTPMVDVAFLLLIFFMVTTVFRRPLAMEVNLPEPGARVEVPESNVMTIYVDRDEQMFWKIGTSAIEPITWPQIEPTLAANQAANPNLIALVKIHREARYEPFVDMLDALDEAEMQRFSLVPMQESDVQALEGVE